ncbi:GNAT family N-acetyltransferase [Cupriavidus sp. 2TAF22]|uniref:GNAT family N-acetyltransferase n=1 Tax=unclassified Cupriavidus TaxID=2640874 RepID=UPI003F91DEC3
MPGQHDQAPAGSASGAGPVTLETARLRLRQWRDADFAPFAALNADPLVMACFPAPLERAASDAMALRCQDLIAARGWGLWAAERKADGAFIGFVGLHEPAATLPFSPCVEIGWRLAHAYWGQGYATEAARAALRFGFGRLGLAEIVSFTALPNVRSRAVMERVGMVPDGTFDHPAVAQGSPLRAHWLYRLAAARWRAQGGPTSA